MHWVDRGPEPDGLAAVRLGCTNGWVAHYQNGVGNRPNDSEWRRFSDKLSEAFSGICGYCEERTAGEVDHFRPISRFPSLVYEWSNWVFACHYCNRRKSNRWPADEYVDPCAERADEWPERYFAFDTVAGALILQSSLPPSRRQRAGQTISDLQLNTFHHLKNRLFMLDVIDFALGRFNEDSEEDWAFLDQIIDRANPFSSFARVVLAERGFEIVY